MADPSNLLIPPPGPDGLPPPAGTPRLGPFGPHSAELLSAIVESSDDAILSKDLNGIIASWNAGAERIFGYQSHETIGQHFSRFFLPEDIVTGQAEYELTTAMAEGRAVSNCWQTRKNGTRFFCQAIVPPLLDEK